MSTAPPPPFGPGNSSLGGFDRKTLKAQRRAAEAQARRQRDADRAQRRAQLRAVRRHSVVGPVLLLSLGILLLLIQTGALRWQSTLDALGRWWPAVLVLAGVLMVAEWAFDRRQLRAGHTALAPLRYLGAGTVFLLLLLAIAGAAVMAAQRSPLWARRNLDQTLRANGFGNWRQSFGLRSEFTQELHAPLDKEGRLTIEDPRGDVTVTGSSVDGQVHVSVHQHIFSWQTDDVGDRRNAEKVQFTGNAARLVLSAALTGEDDADLTVEIPHDAALTVHDAHGDVALEELHGTIEITAAGGDVHLTALRGPVTLQVQNDDADITAHSLGGGLTLAGRTGDLDLSDIEGPVSLHGDFFGTTHLERIRGAVHFQSSFTDFTCAGVPGDVNVEGRSDFEADQLLGPVVISTTNRNLQLKRVRGGATIDDRNGSVSLEMIGPAQTAQITNQNGSINLVLPPDQSFALHARTQNGEIVNDFGAPGTKNGERSDLSTQLGRGGPLVQLQTTEGDIHLRKQFNTPDKDGSDEPAQITPEPTRPDAEGTTGHPHRQTL